MDHVNYIWINVHSIQKSLIKRLCHSPATSHVISAPRLQIEGARDMFLCRASYISCVLWRAGCGYKTGRLLAQDFRNKILKCSLLWAQGQTLLTWGQLIFLPLSAWSEVMTSCRVRQAQPKQGKKAAQFAAVTFRWNNDNTKDAIIYCRRPA
jgi:hypothetical protein